MLLVDRTIMMSIIATVLCTSSLADTLGETDTENSNQESYEYKLELSFGSSLLFVEQPLLSWEDQSIFEERVMPISSVLILGEYLLTPRWSMGAMINIPTTTKRRVVNGSVQEEHAAASLGLGAAFTPVNRLILEDRASFRLQTALLGAYAINSTEQYRFFPVTIIRSSLSTPRGSSMYIGTAFAFKTDTLALIYGVSQLF